MVSRKILVRHSALFFMLIALMFAACPVSGAPAVDVKELYPAGPTTVDDITLNVTCSDVTGGGTLTAYWDIYINDSKISALTGSLSVTNETETVVFTIDSANYSVDDTVVGVVFCGNGTENSSAVNTSTRTITNSRPTTSAPSISPTLVYETTATVTCVNASVADLDGDSVTWSYQWFVDDVPGLTTQTVAYPTKDTVLICEITANDGTGDSISYNSSAKTVLENANVGAGRNLGEIPAGMILGMTDNLTTGTVINFALLLLVLGFSTFAYTSLKKRGNLKR